MILEGETLIPADRSKVWEALNDADVLRECIPGCQELEKTSDTDFTSKVRASVGPVSATFGAKISLEDIEPGKGYNIVGQGKGGAAGFARGSARVDLTDEEGGTRLRYTADVKVGGKLAQVGSRLIQGTAKKLSEQFFGNLTEKLGPERTEDEVAASPGPAAETTAGTSRTKHIAVIAVASVVLALAVIYWAVT